MFSMFAIGRLNSLKNLKNKKLRIKRKDNFKEFFAIVILVRINGLRITVKT